LERLVASELDTLALVNRIALLESRFVDAIHKQQLRIEALENRYTGTSLQENPHPPSDGTQAESEVLSRLAGWENQLAEIKSWQQTLASVREQTEKGTEAHSRLEDYVKQQIAQLQAQISELQDTICASRAIATPNAKLQKETTDKIAATQLPSESVKTSHKEAMPPVGVAPEADEGIAAEPINKTVQPENENNQLSTGDVLPEVAREQELTFTQPQTAATDKTLTPESSSPTKEEELTPPVLPLSNSSTTAPSLVTNSALDSSPDTTPNPESDNANCSELELTPEEMAEHLGITKSAIHQEAVKGHEAFRK
jgi:predicted ribosome quality control (RQC) complex YloA/Tae2 family protein